jgi:hypothetical protein
MSPIRADEPGGPGETTQVVRNQPPQPQNRQEDGERTQVVPGAPGPLQPAGPGQQPTGPQPTGPQPAGPHGMPSQGPPPHGVPPWQQGDVNPGTPWGSMDLPPSTDTTPAWFKQGPEFESTPSTGHGRTIALVAAVVALVLVAGAVVFFVVRNYRDNPGTTVAQTTSSPAPTTTSEAPKRLLGDLVGEVDNEATGPTTLAEARGKQFSPEEGELMAACGADDGEAQVLYRGFWYTQVHVFECTTPTQATTAAAALVKLQERYGFSARTAVNTLPVMQLDNATDVPDVPVDGRIFYVSGKELVRVEVRGKTPQDVEQGLNEVTKAITEKHPAG